MKTRSALVVLAVAGLGLCGFPRPAFADGANTIAERVVSLQRSAAEKRAKGDFDGAIASCRAAMMLDNRNPEIYADLADALEAKGQSDEAMNYYRESVGEKPNQTWGNSRMEEGDLHLRYAVAAVRHGLYQEAVRAYMLGQQRLTPSERAPLPEKFDVKALNALPAERVRLETAAHVGLALHYAAAGRVEAAQAHVNAALALNPSDAAAQFCAGNLLSAQGKKAEATAAWEKAASGDNGTVRGWAKAALAKN